MPANEGVGRSRGEQLLRIENRFGSTEHYYHFILGYLAPLLLYYPDRRRGAVQLLRSCGPMDAHILALQLPDSRILPRPEWARRLSQQTEPVSTLHGLDSPEFYDAATFTKLRGMVFRLLNLEDVRGEDHLLFIDRGNSPDFYQSDAAESKTSANLRRSVPNMQAIADAVAGSGRAVHLVRLEAASLPDQVRLFASSRVVVAQHGAALVNMLWMAPGGAVVEINPMRAGTKFVDYFRLLAEACGHRYVGIAQKHPHARVEPELVLRAVDGLKDVLF